MAVTKSKMFIEMQGKQLSVEAIEKACKAKCPKAEFVYVNTTEGKAYCVTKVESDEPVCVEL